TGTKFYSWMAVDSAGRQSPLSPTTSVTVDGTQTVTVTMTAVPGQVAMNPCRGTTATNGLCADNNGSLTTKALTFDDGTNNPKTVSADVTYSLSPVPSTGMSEGLSSAGVSGHQFNLANGKFSGQAVLPSAGYTATRTYTMPDGNITWPTTAGIGTTFPNFTG